MFEKIRSIKVSERVLDLVKDDLELEASDDFNNHMDIDGWLETFNNCREQGYMLVVTDSYKHNRGEYFNDMYIWVAEQRNSDAIVVYIDTTRDGVNNKITEAAYNNAVFFSCGEYQEAADYIISEIKKAYDKYRSKLYVDKL